jgi:branched-chain amino acid transport system substrate-binding protein
MMKKILMASAATMALTGAAQAEDVTLGVILGFTGPIESITPAMADGAELAIAEVNDSGMFMDGMTVTAIRADSTCIDSSAANAAAERLITSDGVDGIVGADCSGVTTSILTNVAVPNGMVMISPSATSPALSTVEDGDLFFRTAPSDARQGVVMSEIIMERGFDTVAVTYTNNDYGQGLADSFAAAFEEMGGTVTLVAAHEDGRADYSAEVGALASAGGDLLVVAGYVDQGGSGIIQAALDTGAFDTFVFPDGMVGPGAGRQLRLRHRRVVRPEPRHRQRRRLDLPEHGRRGRLRRHLALLCRKLRRGGAADARHGGGRLQRSGGLCR